MLYASDSIIKIFLLQAWDDYEEVLWTYIMNAIKFMYVSFISDVPFGWHS